MIEPQKLDERPGVSLRIPPTATDCPEFQAVWGREDPQHAPPPGDNIEGFGQKTVANDERRLVEHLPVDVNLIRESAQIVSV